MAKQPLPEPEPAPETWVRRHLWEIQPIRDALVVLGIWAVFWLGAEASLVTIPFLLALLLAYLFEPLIRRLSTVSFVSRRSAAASLAVGSAVILGGSLLLALAFSVLQTVHLATRVFNSATATLASVANPGELALRDAIPPGAWLEIRDVLVDLRSEPEPGEPESSTERVLSAVGLDRGDMEMAIGLAVDWAKTNSEAVKDTALATGGGAVDSVFTIAGSLGAFLFGIFLTAFFFYFFATHWDGVIDFAKSLVPSKNRERVLHIASKMDGAIAGFVRGRLVIALCLTGFYSVCFAFLGVPAALLLGTLIALLALVPYAVIAGIPVVILLLWLESHTGFRGEWWWILGAPIVVYWIGQFLDDYVLTPAIQGKTTDLATPEIVFASLAAGTVFGFFGLLLAIPVAACLKILLKEVFWPRYREWREGKRPDILPLDGEPVPETATDPKK